MIIQEYTIRNLICMSLRRVNACIKLFAEGRIECASSFEFPDSCDNVDLPVRFRHECGLQHYQFVRPSVSFTRLVRK